MRKDHFKIKMQKEKYTKEYLKLNMMKSQNLHFKRRQACQKIKYEKQAKVNKNCSDLLWWKLKAEEDLKTEQLRVKQNVITSNDFVHQKAIKLSYY